MLAEQTQTRVIPQGEMKMTSQLTTRALTIKGNTFKCPAQLKSEGFKFDVASKTWSREVNIDDAGAVYYGEKFQGSAESYAHHWKCYAKNDVLITVE